jgi:hypothetical protein
MRNGDGDIFAVDGSLANGVDILMAWYEYPEALFV